MPTYSSPRHGVSVSEALQEASAVAPISRAMLTTIEIWHPALSEPVRIVNDHEPLTATLEAYAPRNAGEAVEFVACQVGVTRPEENDAASTPEITLTAGNVSGILSNALKVARGSLVPWQVIERLYASDDLSGPAVLPPMTLTMTGAEINGLVASIRASFGDPVNVAVPRITFKRSEYPGLAAR